MAVVMSCAVGFVAFYWVRYGIRMVGGFVGGLGGYYLFLWARGALMNFMSGSFSPDSTIGYVIYIYIYIYIYIFISLDPHDHGMLCRRRFWHLLYRRCDRERDAYCLPSSWLFPCHQRTLHTYIYIYIYIMCIYNV